MKCVVCGNKTFSSVLPHYHGRQVNACRTCGLVQVVPMPSEKEISALYHDDIKHFEPYIKQLSVHRSYFKEKVREIQKKGTLLDIGCAMGVLLEEAQKVGLQAQGIDISKDAVAYCRKKGLRVSQTWPKGQFDVITAFEILEHERDPLGMVRRIHKLLKAGGVAVLTTPNHDSIWRKIMGTSWVGYHHPEHVTFWDEKSLTYLMKKAKFANVEVRRDSPRPFPLSFAFTRGADYFPWLAWLFRPIGKLVSRLHIINPINPWDDLLVYATK